MTNAPLRTSHLTLRVADLARSAKFYRDAFGFEELGGDGTDSILLGGDGVVMLALTQAADPDAPHPRVEPEPFIGMEHFAFELAPDEFATLQAFYRRLKEIGATIDHTADHIITNSIYFLDPDRNTIEAYVNCPRERFATLKHPYGTLDSLDDALEGRAPPPANLRPETDADGVPMRGQARRPARA